MTKNTTIPQIQPTQDLPEIVSETTSKNAFTATSRDASLDIARGIGIIMVVTVHVESISIPARLFIVNFIMPFFFVLSGLLLYIKQEEKKSFMTLAKRKLKTIMQPYLVYSLLAVLAFVGYMYLRFLLTKEPVPPFMPFFREDIRYFVTLFGVSVYWFLPALFFAELIFLAIRKNAPNFVTVINVCALAVVARFAQPHLDLLNAIGALGSLGLFFHALIRIAYSTFFLMIGYEFGVLQTYVKRFLKETADSRKHLIIQALIRLVIGALLMTLGTRIGFINGSTDMRSLIIGEPSLYFSGAILSSIGLILVCRAFAVAADLFLFRYLRFLGLESLFIMCTHLDWYLLLAGTIFADFAIKRYPLPEHQSFVYPAMIVVFTLIEETILIFFKNRIKKLIRSKKKP